MGMNFKIGTATDERAYAEVTFNYPATRLIGRALRNLGHLPPSEAPPEDFHNEYNAIAAALTGRAPAESLLSALSDEFLLYDWRYREGVGSAALDRSSPLCADIGAGFYRLLRSAQQNSDHALIVTPEW